jgi:hypothetical protein
MLKYSVALARDLVAVVAMPLKLVIRMICSRGYRAAKCQRQRQ